MIPESWCEHILFALVLLYLFLSGVNLLNFEVSLFIELDIISINSRSVVMTFLLDWMSLIFISFVLHISSIVIHYSGQYMPSDFYINRFIFSTYLFCQ